MEFFFILKLEENRAHELERDQIIDIKSMIAEFLLISLK